VLKFVRGVGAYVSGGIAKLAPDSIRLETPAAIVGVRGTTVAIRVDPQ
jgi:histidinol dehydrogenase